MQRSSAAFAAVLFAILILAAAYFPTLLTQDALAQSVLPSPELNSVSNVAPTATIATAPETEIPTTTLKKDPTPTTGKTKAASPRLVIPSIDLNDPIVSVGLDSTGAMAVPSGKTNEVGWYDGGPMPGEVGSAVLDAHVFAAFTKLDHVSVGDDIYVRENGKTLHFVVTAVKEFALSQITSQDLFVPTSSRDLNLITCAGKLTSDHSTYDHRLVVYSTLMN